LSAGKSAGVAEGVLRESTFWTGAVPAVSGRLPRLPLAAVFSGAVAVVLAWRLAGETLQDLALLAAWLLFLQTGLLLSAIDSPSSVVRPALS
jgi:hypothetical protein